MKRNIAFAVLFVLGLSISACSIGESSFDSSSSESESSISSDSTSSSSNSSSSSSGSSFPSYSYSFENKENGLTLEQITDEINQIDPKPEEQRKVRYTWHIVEKITGNYYKTMLDGSEMPEGEIVGDFVSETRNNNLDVNIQLISGTPLTQMQKYYALNYTSSITPSGWLGYHSQRRGFLKSAQEGEGFEERFYTNPLTLWMRIWGRRPANAQMDGIYFGYEEFERVYNTEGYCTSLKIKEYTYMQGTLSSWNNGSRYYDGSYEYSLTCAIEYLDSPNDGDDHSLPEREPGVSLETFEEEIQKLEPQTNDRKIRVSYHIVETLQGSVPNANYRNGEPLSEGETITDLVLESRNTSASDLKIISGQASTKFSQNFTAGIMIGIKNWLSYHKERRDAMEREAMPQWNVFKESLSINPFKMWMVESGTRPANAEVEGTYFAFNEYERTFDSTGYCQTLLYREYTYIDGTFSRWDTKPQQYKGTFDAVATATIEYLDIE